MLQRSLGSEMLLLWQWVGCLMYQGPSGTVRCASFPLSERLCPGMSLRSHTKAQGTQASQMSNPTAEKLAGDSGVKTHPQKKDRSDTEIKAFDRTLLAWGPRSFGDPR